MHSLQRRACLAVTPSTLSWTLATSSLSPHGDRINQQRGTDIFSLNCSRSTSYRQQCLQFRARARRPLTHCQASVLHLAAVLPGICFDQQCPQAADRAFLIVTAIPLLGLLVAVILRYKPIPSELLEKAKVTLCLMHYDCS